MPRKLIKKFFPNQHLIKEHKYLQFLGSALHDHNLWHLHRRSVAGAFAVGLFWTFIPIPLQMVWAAITAIVTRVNLPISVMLVWITNPLTMGPIFYFAYKLGQLMLGSEPMEISGDIGIEWFQEHFDDIWQPLFLGSFLISVTASIAGYVGMRIFWRLHVLNRWRKTHCKRNE
jgi:uncharacterized protein (DUF2062 family)